VSIYNKNKGATVQPMICKERLTCHHSDG